MDGHSHGLWDSKVGVLATKTGGDVLAAFLMAGGCFISLVGYR